MHTHRTLTVISDPDFGAVYLVKGPLRNLKKMGYEFLPSN